MKPKPFSPLNHLTVPCAMNCSSQVRWSPHGAGTGRPRWGADVTVTPKLIHRLVPAGVHNTSTETDDLTPTTPGERDLFRSRGESFRRVEPAGSSASVGCGRSGCRNGPGSPGSPAGSPPPSGRG